MPSVSRIVELDALRGFALLGILLVNIGQFASTFHGIGLPDPFFDGLSDRLTAFTVIWLLGLKFYLIFSFLFGYSFAVQMRAAERAGVSFAPLFLRRQAALWLVGVLHAVLLFHGDILTTYALLGVALLLLSKRGDRGLLRLAGWLIGGTAALWALLGGVALLAQPDLDLASSLERAFAAMRAYRDTPASVIAQHVSELSWVGANLVTVQAPCALAMFLVGLVLGRRGLIEEAPLHQAALRRLARWGLAIGLPGTAPSAFCMAMAPESHWALLALSLSLLTAPLLAGAYVALVLLFFQSKAGIALRDALAPAGRMALSNYLAQSLVCALIFHAYGLGLVGQVSPLSAVLFGLLIFLLQLACSGWWMRRFERGPLEAFMPRTTPSAGRLAAAG
jgi:uncharacterized protein